jgi:uncharacterized protein YecE (DUF72 family)
MRLQVGCAMWTHAPWQGSLIPHPLPPSERLRAYASWCNAVEGNTTFYATPSVSSVESWAAQTSADFRFVVKLPKTVTHEQRLRRTDALLQSFFTAMEPLGPRNHAFWIQLPASFAPGDLGVLAAFLHGLPRSYRYAVEVRHPAFFDDERSARQLEQVLGRVGAEWVPFDTVTLFRTPASSYAEREAWMKKPRVLRRSRALTATPIVRYIGRDDPSLTIAGWDYLVQAVVEWLGEGRSPTVFLHTPDNVDALKLARRFYSSVAAVVPLEALPEPLPAAPPTLF